MSIEIKASVVGQGYVGLPLALAAVESGCTVFGIDNDQEKVDLINSGISPIEDIGSSTLAQTIKTERYKKAENVSAFLL